MKTWEDYKEESRKAMVSDIEHYKKVVKYARHSKKKKKAERELENTIEQLNLRNDIENLSFEEFCKKYPDFHEIEEEA